ncbi:MAG TPA: NUDIX domain-containing protein [candidate division Zixibacteria bacterium]|nr:NUDIX domain-containing protein [candidate division Zixibacteria bacterium]
MVHVPACPHCAAPVERPLTCGRCGWQWYANPMPAAGTLVERAVDGDEPRVLLLRRAVEPGRGAWDLPAGYLEANESPEQAALRETREEAGFEVTLVRLVGVYTSRPGNAVSAIYLARPLDPAAVVAVDAESDGHAWVSRVEVPDWIGRMAFPSMAAALEDWASGVTGRPRQW